MSNEKEMTDPHKIIGIFCERCRQITCICTTAQKKWTHSEYYLHMNSGMGAIAIMNKDKVIHYGDLRAKEAVKEFAVSILNAISDLDAQNAIILELRKRKLM